MKKPNFHIYKAILSQIEIQVNDFENFFVFTLCKKQKITLFYAVKYVKM